MNDRNHGTDDHEAAVVAQRHWQQWRYRFTADGPDVGDEEHARLNAIFAAADKERRERWAQAM